MAVLASTLGDGFRVRGGHDIQFGLLGPLTVRRDGAVVPIPAAKQRVVLAALLLTANQMVSLDDLAAAVWGTETPPSARATLQNYVRRLRQALADIGRYRILTHPRGYRICVDAAELDVTRFEDLQRDAREAARQGAWDQAAAGLRAALTLWRGQPLADVPSEILLLRHLPSLAEMHAQAVESRIDADLHLGRHNEVISELRQFAATHPMRERSHALLMLALYRDGRQAEALTAYQQARHALVTELGVEPGPDLRELHGRILAADPGLALQASVVPRQLPAATPHFAGRQAELDMLTDLLRQAADAGAKSDGAAVVISAIGGTAGVGKSALAIYWAHRVADAFPDGQLHVNLRGFDPSGMPVTPADAIRGFLGALGVPAGQIPSSLDAQTGLYRSLLAGRRLLVVLDNAADAAQVRPLLPGSPGCLVLVTSRRELAGLLAEGAAPVTLDLLTEAEARELLTRRLGAPRVAAEPVAAAELARLCARLPLALAVAAARAAAHPGFPLASLAAELRDARSRLDALDAGDASADVRAVFSWSCRNLTEPAGQMFRLLGLHPGPDISVPAAASLAGVPIAHARRALHELTGAHLLTEHVPGRYACHDLLRAYAGERAASTEPDAGSRAAVHRVLDHYLHTAHAAALTVNPSRDPLALAAPLPGVTPEVVDDEAQALAWLEAEHAVLLAAVAASDGPHAWQLAWTLTDFFDRCGHWHDLAATQHTALAAAQRLGDTRGEANAHRELGRAYALLGSYDEAGAHLRHALDAYRQAGDHSGEARTYAALGWLAERQQRPAEALGHAQHALGLYRAAGHRGGQAHALNAVGWGHALLGDYGQALVYCQQSLELHRELGHTYGEAAAWDSLGYAYHHLGQHGQASLCYQQALGICREAGDSYHQADVLTHLGESCHAAHDTRAAREAWQQALTILDDLRHSDAEKVRARLRELG